MYHDIADPMNVKIPTTDKANTIYEGYLTYLEKELSMDHDTIKTSS